MRTKKLATVMMCVALLVGSFPLTGFAEDHNSEEKSVAETEAGAYSAKDEAIYGKLDASGILQDMYVVNTFHVTKPGVIVDHGNYTNVRNLSNLLEIEQPDDSTVRFQAEEDAFYYQGDMANRPLPWDITITYVLNGKEVEPDELAGKSGALEIQITTSANRDVDPVFFENYVLQISLTLDPSKVNDIQAPDGTKARAGKDTQVTFTAMPEQEEAFIVSANVTEFEMDPIDISAAPFSMSIDDPDLSGMTGEMQSLSDAIREINQGVEELNSGISDLDAGAADLSNGSSTYLNGINGLDQSSGELVNGSARIRDVLQNVSDAVQESPDVPDLSELRALPEGLRELAGRLREYADGLEALRNHYDEAHSNLNNAMNVIPNYYEISDDQIRALYESGADQGVVDQLIETYEEAHKAKEAYHAVQEVFDSVTGTLEQFSKSIRKIANSAETTAAKIEKGLEEMDHLDALDELREGLFSLASEYQSFHSGLVNYTDGVSRLAASYQELDSGIQDLSEGTSSLDSGANELQNGTQELQEATSDLPGDLQSEVDEMMDDYDASDFEPKSFVSEQNEKVDVVQFVLQTEPIEVEEPETTEEADEEEKSFWDRLMDLFKR